MKRFILRTLSFLLILVVADFSLGQAFAFMQSHAIGGNNGRVNYVCNKTSEDILIFGSSRASHHYNPQILTDSLGLSAFNCGERGNGIILNYGRLLMIEERYKPKVIIYEVTYSFDLLKDDNHKYLGYLKSYYDRPGIKEIFQSVDKTEQWKMKSLLYRYNSNFLSIMADRFLPINSMGTKGFLPLSGELDTLKIRRKGDDNQHVGFDSLKLDYIQKFIDHCKDVKLIFAVSPSWYGISPDLLRPIYDICKEQDIPLLDFSNDPKYVHNNAYSKDGAHMNARGADEFTRDVVKELKKRGIISHLGDV